MLRKRKGSPYWWYGFSVNGVRFRGSTETASKAVARQIAEKKRADIVLAVGTGKKPEHTIDELFGQYWARHAHRLPTAGNIRYQAANLVSGLGKHTRLTALASDAIAGYVAKRRGSVSDASVNRELTLLRAALRRADAWGWAVPRIEWKPLWLAEPDKRDRTLSVSEARRLLAAAAPHLRPAIEFSLLTGVRLSNCIKLDWRQVDMHSRTITFRVKSAKPGGKSHVLPMSEPLFVLLANFGPRDEGRVFLYNGRPVTKFRTSWRTALRKANITDFRWHDLRHTAATWMVNNGVPLDLVQRILGHANIQTTQRYAHRDTNAAAGAMDQLAAQFWHTTQTGGDEVLDMKGKIGGRASAPKAGALPG